MSSDASGSSGPASRSTGLDDRDLGTEPADDLPDLEADGAAADDQQGRGHLLGRDRVRGSSSAAPPSNIGGTHGPLPGGEDEGAPGRDGPAVDLDRSRAGDPALATDEAAALVLEARRRRPRRPTSPSPRRGCAGRPAPSPG